MQTLANKVRFELSDGKDFLISKFGEQSYLDASNSAEKHIHVIENKDSKDIISEVMLESLLFAIEMAKKIGDEDFDLLNIIGYLKSDVQMLAQYVTLIKKAIEFIDQFATQSVQIEGISRFDLEEFVLQIDDLPNMTDDQAIEFFNHYNQSLTALVSVFD